MLSPFPNPSTYIIDILGRAPRQLHLPHQRHQGNDRCQAFWHVLLPHHRVHRGRCPQDEATQPRPTRRTDRSQPSRSNPRNQGAPRAVCQGVAAGEADGSGGPDIGGGREEGDDRVYCYKGCK